VDLFFSRHDATTMNRQKNDVGTQYRSAIFTHGPEQQEVRWLESLCCSCHLDRWGDMCGACACQGAAWV